MPPRYAYWTILIDHKPTAFRAREKEELQPTFFQLQRTNKDVVMKWFARGRLWETPEQAHEESRKAQATREKRGREWRPGGQHQDPRDRFKKRPRPAPSESSRPKPPDVAQVFRPVRKPRESRPWHSRPARPAQTAKKPEPE